MLVQVVPNGLVHISKAQAATAGGLTCTGGTTSGSLTISAIHGKAFYFDAGSVDAAYIGYKLTNSGSAVNSPTYITVGNFRSSGSTTLEPVYHSEDTQTINSIGASSSASAYFFIKTNATGTQDINQTQTHAVKVYSSNPNLSGATPILSCEYIFEKIIATLSASANKVTGLSVSSTSPAIGDTLTVTQTGTTGIIGNSTGATPDGKFVWLTPASKSTFRSDKLRLIDVTFTTSKTSCSIPSSTLIATFTTSGSCNDTDATYEAKFIFRVIGSGVAVPIIPTAQITSGNQVKHSVIASGVSLTIDLRSAPDNFSIQKSLLQADLTSYIGTDFDSGTVTTSGRFASNFIVNRTSGSYFKVGYAITVSNGTSNLKTIDEIVDSVTVTTILMDSTTAVLYDSSTATSTSIVPTLGSDGKFHFTGPFSIAANNSVVVKYNMYIPVGSDLVTYINNASAIIGSTVLSSTGSISIAVEPAGVSLPAIARDDTYTTTVNTSITKDVSLNDTKFGNNDTFTASTLAGLTFYETGTAVFETSTAGTYSFTYTMYKNGASDSKTATVTITVSAGPGPSAIDDTYRTNYNTSLSGSNVKTNDSLPSGGTYTYSKGSQETGTVTSFSTSDGTFNYAPRSGFFGVDTFTVTVCNAASACDTSTVTINVGPNATDDSKSTSKNTSTSGNVTTNDNYPSGSTITKATDPENGTLVFNADGTYTYTPSTDFTGTDSFTYTICLPSPNDTICSTATVTITVSAPASSGSGSSGGGGPINIPTPTPTNPPGNSNPPARFTPVEPGRTNVIIIPPPAGGRTEILINGNSVCTTTSGTCSVPALLGPKAKIEAVTTNPDGTKSTVILPSYAPEKPIPVLTVYFAVASSKLTKTEIKKLDEFVKLMKEQGFTRVVLEGHTDVQGSKTGYNNLKLSQNRSQIVAKYLSKFLTVKISKDFLADTKPAIQGSGEVVYKNNRRTEVSVW